MNLDEIMDPRKLRELRELGDGDDFLLDLLERYVDKSREQLEEARGALAENKLALLEDIIHSWKGATTALGLTELLEELSALNHRLKAGDAARARESLDLLDQGLKRISVP